MPIAFSKKDLNSTAWFSLEKLILLFTSIYITPKIFNTLGTVDIGKLYLIESVLGMFTPVFFLGLSAISIREMVINPNASEKIIATTFVMRFISWVVLCIGLILYLTLTEQKDVLYLYIILLLSYLFRLTDVLAFYFLAIKQTKLIFISKIISLSCCLALQYYGVKNNMSVLYFASVIALDFLLQGLIYGIALLKIKDFSFKKLKVSFPLGLQLLNMSVPLIVSGGLVMVYIGIDEIILKHFYHDHANGVFASVEFLVIGLSWPLGFAIINALYPALAESYAKNKSEYKLKFKQLTGCMMLLGISIGLFYTIFGDYILTTYFSEQYNEAKSALYIFCWAPLLVFMGMLYEKHLLNINQLQHEMYRFAIGCVVNIMFCLVLIPKYYINGAAMAILASHFIVNIIYPSIYLYFKKRKTYTLKLN